jgi:site-specific DNA-methyltransferase (adenine-specific)
MDVMKTFPDGHFDLAIVDPPYGSTDAINVKNGASHKKARKEYHQFANVAPSPEYFEELRRVSKHQIVWGGNHFGLKGGAIFWQKVYDTNKGVPFGEGEIAHVSFQNKVSIFKFVWQGCWQGDMANFEKRIHPTQKPVALYKRLLADYAKPGMRIIDTHMGSGSIAIAAHYAGVHLTACEIDPEYFEAAKARIAKETAQTELFIPHNA